MPPKVLPKPRAWGTRFDPLPSSPPTSPRTDEMQNETVTRVPSEVTGDQSIMPFRRTEQRVCHEASIFVGSLPSNVDQQELARLLSEHLQEYSEIRNTKVVRDSKGGLCAFVQCEDAASASQLLRTLKSSETRPFLGRLLRYEPARAFKTLLISYRTPMRYVQSCDATCHTILAKSGQGRYVELELPFAMRLWRPWRAKYTSVMYNSEAHEAECRAVSTIQAQNVMHAPGSPTLYLDPLVHDAQTIHKIALHFGTLEHFGPVIASPSIQTTQSNGAEIYAPAKQRLYPGPHNARRSAVMDPGCWEVKWKHRDDCINAWMTLRNVPHLTVTWAHQTPSPGLDCHLVDDSSCQQCHESGRAATLIGGNPATSIDGEHHSRVEGHLNSSIDTCLNMPASIPRSDVPTPNASSPLETREKDIPPCYEPLPPKNPDVRTQSIGTKGEVSADARSDWTDKDFPPLGEIGAVRRTETDLWSNKGMPRSDGKLIRSYTCASTTTFDDKTAQPVVVYAIKHTKATNLRDEHRLESLPTPDLALSPVTPRTPGSMFPETPTCDIANFSTPTLKHVDGTEASGYCGDLTMDGEKDLDLTTIFVGGLEMSGPSAWDEQKIRDFFAKFGMVENVKFVRPLNGKSAFAFVKFDDVNGPARAVTEAHNSMHGGRQMRVQIRDCNPSHRGVWKSARWRGRPQPYAVQRPQPEDLDSRYCPVRDTSTYEDHRRPDNKKGSENGRAHNLGESLHTAATTTEFPTLNNDPPSNQLTFRTSFPLKADATMGERPVSHARHYGQATFTNPQVNASTTPTSSQSRDRYDESTLANPALPPSLSSSSMPATVVAPHLIPYPFGFYSSPAWVQQMPPLPLPVPYMTGYAGLPVPALQPNILPGPDSTGNSASWAPINTLYGSYVPYTAFPINVQGLDPSQTLSIGHQAPVVPTGFIQGDQGTLIAVYNQDALEQYMSTARSTVSSQPQNGARWQQQQQAPSSFESAMSASRPSHSFSGSQIVGWINVNGVLPEGIPANFHPPDIVPDTFASHEQFPSSSGPSYSGAGVPSPLLRRNQRGGQYVHDSTRNGHNRTVSSRFPSGNNNQVVREAQISPPPHPQFSGSWDQWAAIRQ